jgi:signal transduction histidine kinase
MDVVAAAPLSAIWRSHAGLPGFAKPSTIQVQLEIAEPSEQLSKNCELALFRVLQETLTNVHRHSRASAADVTFTISDNQLQPVVHDDGGGIEDHHLQ